MSPEEAFMLCRLAKGAFPASAVDEFTPDSWALAFEDDRFEDAKVALKQLMREQTFIHTSDIVARIKRIRSDRLLEFGPLPDPPAGLTDAEEMRWLCDIRRAIADGDQVERPALPAPGTRPAIDFKNLVKADVNEGADA